MRRASSAPRVLAIAAVAGLSQVVNLWADEPYKPYNAEAASLKNPIVSSRETIDKGKALYRRHCASCHGVGGKGDGGQALSGGEPSDLTDGRWDTGSTDGEIFVAIRDGLSADMLAYKDRLKDNQMWTLVVYLRSLGPKPSK
jgi:mono/diheme cytochrome c family protein